MATLVNKMNREVKVIIPNMREFRTFYSDNEGVIGMFFKRDWEEVTQEEWKAFEDALLKRGYSKWFHCLYGEEEFDVSTMVRDGDKKLYQLIFRFWDFEQFKEGAGYSVDFVVMPCIDGRMDAICSSMANDLDNNVEFAEQFAKDYYKFVIKQIEK